MEEKNSILSNVKYNYNLLFHPEKIEAEISKKDLTDKEKKRKTAKIYKDKSALHAKLGAKQFQKVVIKFDELKFKFLKKCIGEKRSIRLLDKLTDYQMRQNLKTAKTDEEKIAIIENSKRAKNLTRVQMHDEKSANYFPGVDKREENFPFYLENNKRIHQDALKRNGIIFIAGLGLSMVTPSLQQGLIQALIPLITAYQVPAAIKNLQCINIQDYNLSRMKKSKDAIVKVNVKKIEQLNKDYEELLPLLQKQKGKEIQDIKEQVQEMDSNKTIEDIKTEEDNLNKFKELIEHATTEQELKQLRELLLTGTEIKYPTIKVEYLLDEDNQQQDSMPDVDKALEEMIMPQENKKYQEQNNNIILMKK